MIFLFVMTSILVGLLWVGLGSALSDLIYGGTDSVPLAAGFLFFWLAIPIAAIAQVTL